MSKSVIATGWGGPEVLEVREVDTPHAGAGQIRVGVAAAGLNPMDWVVISNEQVGAMFGITMPVGFGYDLAGIVDEVGAGVTGFAVGDRVFGGAMSRAVAEYAVLSPTSDDVAKTPAGVDDITAATIAVAGSTAVAALNAASVGAGDTVLIGGAAGGVGVFAVQLARLAGARVLGTSSEGSFEYLRSLGAEPVTYGAGLEDRVRAIAPEGIHAALDLFGIEAAEAALALGVAPERVSTIAAPMSDLPVKKTGGTDAPSGTLQLLAERVAAGDVHVPIAERFGIDHIREAVTQQADRHTRGKIVVTL